MSKTVAAVFFTVPDLSGGLSEPEGQSKGEPHINGNADTWNDSAERRGTRFPVAQSTGASALPAEGKDGGNPNSAPVDFLAIVLTAVLEENAILKDRLAAQAQVDQQMLPR